MRTQQQNELDDSVEELLDEFTVADVVGSLVRLLREQAEAATGKERSRKLWAARRLRSAADHKTFRAGAR